MTPAQLLDGRTPDEVRVHVTDTAVFVVRRPRIARDSLTGAVVTREGREFGLPEQRAIPLKAVTQIETKAFSAGKTLGLAGGLLAGVFFVGLIACAQTQCLGPS